MQTITIGNNFKIGFDELAQSLSQLNANDLNDFFVRLQKASVLTVVEPNLPNEIILLRQIKTIIPASVVRRFKTLQNKQHNQTITEKELSEMLMLTDFMEEKSAERVMLLANLAKIKNTTPRELARQLRLKTYHA